MVVLSYQLGVTSIWGQWTWAVRNTHTTCTCVAIVASNTYKLMYKIM